jgi:hypothetical protein
LASTRATSARSHRSRRQAGLVEQLVAPGLRSRNPERRKAAFEDLDALAVVAQELSQLLFLRDLRGYAERAS